jgi:hypothetical protein
MIKIKKKYYTAVFTLFTCVVMTFLMSGSLTFINLGLANNFLSTWVKNWGVAFAIAYPILLILVPKVKVFLEKVVLFH